MSFLILLEADRSDVPDCTHPERSAPCCEWCGHELNEEEIEYPRRNESGEKVCDNCWSEEYEGECDRCGEIVEKKELDMNPGELLAFWKDFQGLKQGYYRVRHWPIYANGMITGHVYHDALEFVAPLDKRGSEAARHAWTPGGCLCLTCRNQIEAALKANQEGRR